MSKQIQYSDEPIGEFKLVTDFLPSPSELALKNKNTKITISLSSDSLSYFKDVAETHHMQYQKIIRQLLDEYVANQRKMPNKKIQLTVGSVVCFQSHFYIKKLKVTAGTSASHANIKSSMHSHVGPPLPLS